MDIIHKINKDGYYLLDNVFTEDEIKLARSSINNELVNYHKIDKFINNVMLIKANKLLNIECHYTKYRVSNNTNSSDAGTFHRDIIMFNKSNTKIPSYTCLLYLDESNMEIIPESHNNLTYSLTECFSIYGKRRL